MGKTALVVDDSRTARVVLQKMLETHDLEVDTAESAEEALNYLSDFRPDIIFMDHQMPGMDGFEAVSAIKNNPTTATIPIMMYTADKGEVYVGQARALGAVGVLPKQLEPVQVSKVLESLRIIGEDADRRERHAEAATQAPSGEYPGLAHVDSDLRVLIQDLFDQQREILRRELKNSQRLIAARVADEIRPPEADDAGPHPDPATGLPGMTQVVVAVMAVITMIFGWLYWHRESSWQALQQQNFELQRALEERRSLVSEGSIEAQRQLDDYRSSLGAATAVALRSLEWAANQSSQYGFDELPLGDYRLSMLQELTGQLQALGFRGTVSIESHVGDFCMTLDGPGGFAAAAGSQPATRCDRIGFEPDEAYDMGLRQSVRFANFINLARENAASGIRYEITSLGNSRPLLDYPVSAAGTTAAAWNEIAASNHRVDISLRPDPP